jgi:3-oxoacyl-[acyl-carrier-protein] synthase III
MKCPQSQGDLTLDDKIDPHSSDYLFMDGTEIFNFTLKAVLKLVADTLKNKFIKSR